MSASFYCDPNVIYTGANIYPTDMEWGVAAYLYDHEAEFLQSRYDEYLKPVRDIEATTADEPWTENQILGLYDFVIRVADATDELREAMEKGEAKGQPDGAMGELMAGLAQNLWTARHWVVATLILQWWIGAGVDEGATAEIPQLDTPDVIEGSAA